MPYRLSVGAGLFTNLFDLVIKTEIEETRVPQSAVSLNLIYFEPLLVVELLSCTSLPFSVSRVPTCRLNSDIFNQIIKTERSAMRIRLRVFKICGKHQGSLSSTNLLPRSSSSVLGTTIIKKKK